MLWILAGISVALLLYEVWTLLAAVLLPLLGNPNALQTDFHYYYDAALRVRADARLYQLSDDVIAGFAYPPPAILPFVALSYVPLGMAMLLMTVASYGALAVAIGWWLRYLKDRGLTIETRTAVAAVLVAVALAPAYSNAVFGQVNAFVLLCAVGFVTIGPSRPAAGGAWLAAGIWLKIYPVLLVAIGLWNRSAWRRIGFAVAAGAVLLALSLSVVPLSSYGTFVGDVLPARFDKTAVHITNQSLIAFIERFSIPPERFLNWTGDQAITVTAAVRALNWLFGIAVIAWLWRRAANGSRVEAVDSAACLMALAAVIAPLGWGHAFMLALPLVLLHLVLLPRARPLHVACVCLAVMAMMLPPGHRIAPIELLAPWAQNLFYSRFLLATLLLIALPPAFPSTHDARR